MEPVTTDQMRASILELKAEIVQVIHGTEDRILRRIESVSAVSEQRIGVLEVSEGHCRGEVMARLKTLEGKRGHRAPDGNGSAKMAMVWTDPKLYMGIALGVGALVWYLVERLIPLLQHAPP